VSRCSSPVSMLAALMATSTVDSSGSSSTWISPSNSAKRPFTLATIRWRAVNSIVVWGWSSAHTPGAGNWAPSYVRTAGPASVSRALRGCAFSSVVAPKHGRSGDVDPTTERAKTGAGCIAGRANTGAGRFVSAC